MDLFCDDCDSGWFITDEELFFMLDPDDDVWGSREQQSVCDDPRKNDVDVDDDFFE